MQFVMIKIYNLSDHLGQNALFWVMAVFKMKCFQTILNLVTFFLSVFHFSRKYLRSHFPQEVKHVLDVTNALLPAADDLFPPHLGSDVAVDS